MCEFPGCDRSNNYGGLCNTHYHQQRRAGEMWPIGSARSLSRTKGARSVPACLHEGCPGDPKSLGYCPVHYHQFKRAGYTWDKGRRPLAPQPPCLLDDCGTPQRPGKSGLCPKHAQSNARHKRAYGITLLERQDMLRKQHHVCAICGKARALHVDHCHTTGRVRALLCGSCNRAIGLFEDSPEVLRRAAQYLEGR